MPDAYTSNKLGLIEPAAGAYSGTWNDPLFANWQTIDAALGGTTSITLSSSNVTLTIPTFPTNANPPAVATSAQNLILKLSGTLTANVTVFLPNKVNPSAPAMGGFWIVEDGTGGAFTVTIKTTAVGSTGVSTVQGKTIIVYVSDGVNVKLADNGTNPPSPSVPAGCIFPYGGYVVPSGYLACDGAVYAQASYPSLYAAILTYWNAGNEGAGNFRVPSLRNMFLRGWDPVQGGIGAYEADSFASHTHTTTVIDPGHVHALVTQNGFSGGAGVFAQSGIYQSNKNTEVGYTNISVYNSWAGGNETRPVNRRVEYIIKT